MIKKLIFALFLFTTTNCFAQTRYLYLAQWEWFVQDANHSGWRSPGGNSIGVIDLRSIPQMSKAGGIPEGFGLFVYDTPQTISKSIFLGNDLNKILSAQIKNKIQTGLNLTLAKNTPLDILWELLTTKADPTGQTFAKPLMPGIDRKLKLYLGGFSLVKEEQFDPIKHPFVLEVIKNDYRRNRQEDIKMESDHYKRVLSAWQEKYKIDYKEFIPFDLPDEGKLPHTTTITENWNCADSASPNCQLTWTIFLGDFDLVTNAIQGVGNGSDNARADTDLATDDHYSQVKLLNIPINGENAGSLARKDATATYTFYIVIAVSDGTADYWLTGKQVSSAWTALGTNTTVEIVADDVIRIEVDGSTLRRYRNGSLQNTTTDTAITGNLRTGVQADYTPGIRLDDFEAGDLVVARRVIFIQ